MESFVRFENVGKKYNTGSISVTALHDVSFDIGRGEVCVIVGQSGAGKTTLLNILGGMDTADSGRVFLGDRDITAFSRRELADYRRRSVGFVFQFYNLIPNLTALENVEIASQLTGSGLRRQKHLAGSDSETVPAISRHSFPAANNSALPLPVP